MLPADLGRHLEKDEKKKRDKLKNVYPSRTAGSVFFAVFLILLFIALICVF